ncbi:UNVERIFIED_CONTAM: hypothetical protein HDU68_012249 [Siphonaria sp. JEL0065]|nr:hypothetical protein HDU68_012249 [Siphonaria sp. JEL0065]
MTYESVFLASCGFWVFITWDGIMNLNTMEIISINFYNFGLFAYSITQIIQIAHDRTSLADSLEDLSASQNSGTFLIAQLALPIVIGLYIPLFAYLTVKLIRDFGWRQYRITGGMIQLQKVFFAYDILLLLIKYSLFFVTGFTVVDLVLTQVSKNGVLIIPIVGSVVGFAIAFAGYYGIRYEHKWVSILYLFGTVAACGYLVNRLYDAYRRGGDTIGRIEVPFLLYAGTAGLLLIGSFVYGVICMMNFGVGLKQVLDMEAAKKRGEFTPREIDLDA